MRQSASTILLLAAAVSAAACGTSKNEPIDLTEPARHRPERQSLLRERDEIAGRPVVVRDQNGWSQRLVAGSGGARAGEPSRLAKLHARGPGSAGPATGGPGAGAGAHDFYLDGAKSAGPTTGGPAGPGAGGPMTPGAGSPTARPVADPASPAGSPVATFGAIAEGGEAAPEARLEAPRDNATVAPLAAGSTDDNVEFSDFLEFLEDARKNAGLKNRFVDLDVAGRCSIRVVDRDGTCVPGRRVTVVDETGDKIIWRGTTQGDGRVPFYPAVAGSGDDLLIVEVADATGTRMVRHAWDGTADTVVRLPEERTALEPLQLDVAFVIDTTGSMRDEIAAIKATLLSTTARLRALGREFDLRYGAVLYRDIGDEYVTAQHPFTGDIEAFDEVLKSVTANGGGDGPESLNQGLAVAVDGLEWRAGAAKVAFLIADAPPHLDYENDVPYGDSLQAAVARGIRTHTVAASGLDDAGSVVMRQIAQFTRGEFVFIEYGGSVQKSAAAHGVNKATGNNLDDILYTRIRDEIAHWGRPDAALVAAGR